MSRTTPADGDRRVRRTRAALNEAILALLLEKPYEAISIQEIAERADLNRATFYLHYGSKEALLVAALESQFDALVAGGPGASPERPIWTVEDDIRQTLDYVAEHAALYKVLLSERGTAYLMNRIVDYIAAYSERELRASLPPGATTAAPLPLIARHFAGSFFALLVWWIQNDRPQPAEAMAGVIKNLCVGGLQWGIGLDNA